MRVGWVSNGPTDSLSSAVLSSSGKWIYWFGVNGCLCLCKCVVLCEWQAACLPPSSFEHELNPCRLPCCTFVSHSRGSLTDISPFPVPCACCYRLTGIHGTTKFWIVNKGNLSLSNWFWPECEREGEVIQCASDRYASVSCPLRLKLSRVENGTKCLDSEVLVGLLSQNDTFTHF